MANRKTYRPESHKIKALIFGDSWSWKTTFWWTAKNAIFLSAESWLLSLKDNEHFREKGIPVYEIKSLNDLKSALIDIKQEITAWTFPFDTVVIDSISEINDIVKLEIEKNMDWKSMTFKERGDLSSTMQSILRSFRDLPLHVLFIAQEKIEKDEDKLLKYKPSLNWKAADTISYYMDIVWYTYVDKSEDKFEFKLIVEPTSYAPTKCRGGFITNDTPIDFEVRKTKLQDWMDMVAKKEVVVDTTKEKDDAVATLMKEAWVDPSFEEWYQVVEKVMNLEKDKIQPAVESLRAQANESKKLDKSQKEMMNILADYLLIKC